MIGHAFGELSSNLDASEGGFWTNWLKKNQKQTDYIQEFWRALNMKLLNEWWYVVIGSDTKETSEILILRRASKLVPETTGQSV